jgi:hypothetical protein
MTNADFAREVLLLIGVLAEGLEASEEQCQTVLRAMNDLADEWADSEVTVNWSPQTDSSAELSLFGGEVNAAKYTIAVRLCPVYGKPLTPELAVAADQAYKRMLRNQLNRSIEPLNVTMPQSEAVRQWYDITSG